MINMPTIRIEETNGNHATELIEPPQSCGACPLNGGISLVEEILALSSGDCDACVDVNSNVYQLNAITQSDENTQNSVSNQMHSVVDDNTDIVERSNAELHSVSPDVTVSNSNTVDLVPTEMEHNETSTNASGVDVEVSLPSTSEQSGNRSRRNRHSRQTRGHANANHTAINSTSCGHSSHYQRQRTEAAMPIENVVNPPPTLNTGIVLRPIYSPFELPDILNSHVPLGTRIHPTLTSSMGRMPAAHASFCAADNTFEDMEPKGCCGESMNQTIGMRWFVVFVGMIGLLCVVIGIILGVLGGVRVTGPEYVTVSLLLIGVGMVLSTVSGVAWRVTSPTPSSCPWACCCCRRPPPPDETFAPRQPRSYDRGPHPFSAMLYQDFQFRPPPPSYQASMQDYRLRLLWERSSPAVAHPSPPPTYRSHASTVRASLEIPATQNENHESSLPPSYRSHDSNNLLAVQPPVRTRGSISTITGNITVTSEVTAATESRENGVNNTETQARQEPSGASGQQSALVNSTPCRSTSAHHSQTIPGTSMNSSTMEQRRKRKHKARRRHTELGRNCTLPDSVREAITPRTTINPHTRAHHRRPPHMQEHGALHPEDLATQVRHHSGSCLRES